MNVIALLAVEQPCYTPQQQQWNSEAQRRANESWSNLRVPRGDIGHQECFPYICFEYNIQPRALRPLLSLQAQWAGAFLDSSHAVLAWGVEIKGLFPSPSI